MVCSALGARNEGSVSARSAHLHRVGTLSRGGAEEARNLARMAFIHSDSVWFVSLGAIEELQFT
jgi:hypothetical protein